MRNNLYIRGLGGAAAALAAALLFLYGAVGESRFAAEDVSCVLKSSWMNPWGRTWFWRGNAARFVDLDPSRAMDAYRESIVRNPLILAAWFSLARLELRTAGGKDAELLYRFLMDDLPKATTWRWRQLLLAADRNDPERFDDAFRFVFSTMPRYRREAMELAFRFWGSWDEVVRRLTPENFRTALAEFMARKHTAAALALYERIVSEYPDALDRAFLVRFVDYLIWRKCLDEARDIWERSGMGAVSSVTNGGFEEPLLKRAFGWRLRSVRGVEARVDHRSAYEGKRSIRLHFLGTENVRYAHLWQIVPVEPGRAYELRFAVRSRRLTTDRGIAMEVRGFRCRGLRAVSDEVTGTRPWHRLSVHFEVPEECEAVRVGVRRSESLKFDNKISGDVWIDAVELVEKAPAEPESG